MAGHFSVSFDKPFTLIGIATSFPIWKIAGELNWTLGIELKKNEMEHIEEIAQEENEEKLFEEAEFSRSSGNLPFYQDIESHDFAACFLFANPMAGMPKETHVFPFILLVFGSDLAQNPDTESILLQLKQAPSILSASDILAYLPESQQRKVIQGLTHYL